MVRAALRCGAHWELHRAGRLLLGLACIWLGTTGLSAEESDYGLLLRESEDSGSAVWLDGRLDLEMAVYRENRNKLSNGVELRRGRLSITSRQHGHWVSQLDADFSDDEVEVKDAWVSVAGEHRGVRLGSFKEPFGLENSISSRYITFAERAMLDALAPRRSIGLAIWSHGRWWYTSAGVFGQGIHRRTRGDEGYALTGRGAVFRGQKSEGVLHIGLSLTRRIPPSGDAAVLFRARPETYVNRDRYLNTGSIPGVEHHTSLGLEAAWVRGPLSVQGEAISTAVARRAPDRQADLWAYYLFGSYLVTGESRPYDREIAEFGRLSPDRRSTQSQRHPGGRVRGRGGDRHGRTELVRHGQRARSLLLDLGPHRQVGRRRRQGGAAVRSRQILVSSVSTGDLLLRRPTSRRLDL